MRVVCVCVRVVIMAELVATMIDAISTSSGGDAKPQTMSREFKNQKLVARFVLHWNEWPAVSFIMCLCAIELASETRGETLQATR